MMNPIQLVKVLLQSDSEGMNKLVSILIIVICYNFFAQDTLIRENSLNDYELVVTYRNTDSIVAEAKLYDGQFILHGEYKYYQNGFLKIEAQYKNGMRNGKQIFQAKNGRFLQIIRMKKDRPHGAAYGKFIEHEQEFTYKGRYKNGVRTGKWVYVSDSFKIEGKFLGETLTRIDSNDSIIEVKSSNKKRGIVELNKFLNDVQDFVNNYGFMAMTANLHLRKGKWRYWKGNKLVAEEQYNRNGVRVKATFFNLYNSRLFIEDFFFIHNR